MAAQRLCNCGSGLPSRELYDARDIYVARVCDACEEKVKSGYRPEIFTDSAYACDEPVEPEDAIDGYEDYPSLDDEYEWMAARGSEQCRNPLAEEREERNEQADLEDERGF